MLTINEIRKSWKILLPEFKNPVGNIFFKEHQYLLSGFELVKLPHGIKGYSIYYQIFSLFRPICSLKELNPIINYGICNTKNMKFDVNLEQSKEEHYQLMNENISMIRKQFIFSELNQTSFNVDDILIKLNNFLDKDIYAENRIPVFTFMMQLSQFANDFMLGKAIFDRFIKEISEYKFLDLYCSMAYNMSKEEFMNELMDIPNKRKELENILYNNRKFLENK